MNSPRGTDEGEVDSYREQYYTDLKEKWMIVIDDFVIILTLEREIQFLILR
jgi:hypothetical protein